MSLAISICDMPNFLDGLTTAVALRVSGSEERSCLKACNYASSEISITSSKVSRRGSFMRGSLEKTSRSVKS